GFRRRLCRARRAAQLQDRRHLHAALGARRQADLSAAHPARLAAHRAGSAPSRAGAGRALARPARADRRAPHSLGPVRGMSEAPKTGMVLAAGLGLRMRPLTDRLPKPLIPLGGRTLLDHSIDRLEASGCERVVVNAHYLAEMVEAHLAARPSPAITLSREASLLETGGGVLQALPLLG